MESILQTLALGLLVIVFVIGLIGIVVPILPGILLIWVGMLVYASVVDGFTTLSPWAFALITLIAVAAGSSNLWLPLLGARKTGASWKTVALGVVGGIAGTFLLPLPIVGTIVGYAAGIILGEYLRLREWRPALRASVGGFVGWGVSVVVEGIGAFLMILIFASQVRFAV